MMYTLQEKDTIQLPDQYTMVYYPYMVSEWSVEYQPLPFMKKRKEKMRVISNLFHKETGLFEWPADKMEALSNEREGIFLPEQYEESARHHTSLDFIRNLYLHKRKVWSSPVIDCLNTYSLYVTYAIFPEDRKGRKVYQMVELATGQKVNLQHHKNIYHYLQSKEVIT
ncbi:hypothetical protein GCM10010954_30090 [Halobacillus andaensis]|uniref:Uncharacterized protein n=1 Tax=Halobacillus andaensis TaxID=1176239 RepID=A0A917B717_HALAA|nr:hypothetical protein [Halobacillus andaensis]MBP2005112.1 hypothetical protein [Halobacillus andaensis]GGF28949.1 hypothetical protein GCM10010954_30090 [Halobacillus andaensis]